MFDPNDLAYPGGMLGPEYDNRAGEPMFDGFTKFEQCAKDFTAAVLPFFLSKYYDRDEPEDHTAMIRAAQVGEQAAEEFCYLMEEREKDAESNR